MRQIDSTDDKSSGVISISGHWAVETKGVGRPDVTVMEIVEQAAQTAGDPYHTFTGKSGPSPQKETFPILGGQFDAATSEMSFDLVLPNGTFHFEGTVTEEGDKKHVWNGHWNHILTESSGDATPIFEEGNWSATSGGPGENGGGHERGQHRGHEHPKRPQAAARRRRAQ